VLLLNRRGSVIFRATVMLVAAGIPEGRTAS
jgi:hypothetical protein